MSTFATETLIAEARRDISDADRCLALHVTPAVHQLHRRLREVTDALTVTSSADWRVLGGVIPGPIPAEWVRVGDRINDHGVTGTITRIVNNGRMVHVYIDSGHVSFAKITRQDWVHVLESANNSDGSTN